MNKLQKIAISFALASAAAVHGMSLAHPEHDEPTPKVQLPEVNASLVRSAGRGKIIFTKGTESVSTVGATGTLTLINAKDKASYPLIPSANNTMTTDGMAKLAKGTRAHLHISFADKTMLATEVVAK